MIYATLIYIALVLPFAYNKYLRKQEFNVYIRLLNVGLSGLLFVYFFTETREALWSVFSDGFDSTILDREFVTFSKSYNYISTYLYLSVCLINIGFTISLGRINERIRKLFVRFLPIFWLVIVNYYYLYYMVVTGETKDDFIINLVIVGGLNLLPIFILYLFYTRKSLKELFRSRNKPS